MESAKEKLEASKASRIDTVKTHLNSECVEGCAGQWLQCAKEALFLNGTDTFQFVISISLGRIWKSKPVLKIYWFMVEVKIETS